MSTAYYRKMFTSSTMNFSLLKPKTQVRFLVIGIFFLNPPQDNLNQTWHEGPVLF